MAIYDEYYVGLREDSDKLLLGYATYVDSTAAFKKRKDNVDSWAGRGNIQPIRFKNIPTEGFKVVGFDSRYSTSNKVFEILDPRGFKLQIYVPEFAKLLMNATIVNGEFQGKYLWARNGKGENYLISPDSDEYKGHISPTKKPMTVKYDVGHIFYDKNREYVYQYVGVYYPLYISTSQSVTHWKHGYIVSSQTMSSTHFTIRAVNAPLHIYLMVKTPDLQNGFLVAKKNKFAAGADVTDSGCIHTMMDLKFKLINNVGNQLIASKHIIGSGNVPSFYDNNDLNYKAKLFASKQEVDDEIDSIKNNIENMIDPDLYKKIKDITKSTHIKVDVEWN